MIQETVNKTLPLFRIKSRSITNYSMSSHHFHDAYEIYYMNEGSRDYFIQDRTYQVQQNNLVLIKPYDIHKTMDTGVYHSRLLIGFVKDFLPFSELAELTEACFSSSSVLSFDPATHIVIESLLRKMVIEASEELPFFETRLQSLLIELLIEIARYRKSNIKADANIAPAHEKVFEIIQFLKSDYSSQITLELLSSRFFISPFYLTRLFKKTTGFTVFEYLQSVRIIEAQRLLKETDRKILDISQSVGFANLSNFGKVFKQLTGTTPLVYRRSKLS